MLNTKTLELNLTKELEDNVEDNVEGEFLQFLFEYAGVKSPSRLMRICVDKDDDIQLIHLDSGVYATNLDDEWQCMSLVEFLSKLKRWYCDIRMN